MCPGWRRRSNAISVRALPVDEWVKAEEPATARCCATRSSTALEEAYEQKEASVGPQVMRYIEKEVMLRTLDQHWREHLAAMDYMRQGIFLRSYAQKNPKQEYKREAFELFSAMLDRIKFDTVTTVSKIQVRSQAEIEREELERQQRLARALQMQHAEAVSPIQAPPGMGDRGTGGPGGLRAAAPRRHSAGRQFERQSPRAERAPRCAAAAPFVRQVPKVGRNEMCPCGSGKKYKHCHGACSKRAVDPPVGGPLAIPSSPAR
jgi:preprotein translocase subunit SecA